MENNNLELVEEELILYLNSRSLQRLKIPKLGIIEKLTNHYWISEEFGLIPRIDVFSTWWRNKVGEQTEPSQCPKELFNGEKCLVNFENENSSGWMYGTTYLMESYFSDYYVIVPEPRYSLDHSEERSGTLRIDSGVLRAVISFRDPDKFEKIIKNIEE